jgi:UDP-N-acetylmuramate dehydrogenase
VGKVNSFYAALDNAGIEYRRDFPIGEKTSFKIGGKAECYLTVQDQGSLEAAVKAAGRAKKELFIMGNLSNVLIADGRIKKVFVELKGEFEEIREKGRATVYAGAGVKLSVMLGWLMKHGLGGLEFLAGIPGKLGGAVYMNAGAFGKGIGSHITKIYFTDRKGNCGIIENGKEAFSYRHSIFQENGLIITGVELKLKKRPEEEIRKEMADLIKLRHSKHPWKAYCAGSFFKNSKEHTAGKLIEEAGLKGKTVGKAEVSRMHANFLINKGGASCKDVVKLADIVKKEVYRKFKVRLEEEVRYIK